MKLRNVFLMSLLLFLWHIVAFSQIGVPIEGKVVYQDGSPAAGARVNVETACTDTHNHFVKEALTNSAGNFSLNSFDRDCNQYRISASHREAFWLPTGDDFFYLAPNGTDPLIELKPRQVPAPILIQLGQRGGELELRAFDEASKSYVFARLTLRRQATAEKTFTASRWFSTGSDGSPYTLFLPTGKYTVEVTGFACHGKAYFSASPPTFEFGIEAGIRQTLILKINTAELQPESSYDNPKGERCVQ